ncbi:MAG: hypothetical protein JOZ00_12740 [Mycobacterium sp.]|uniref:hypothetical protein n=1 Tax=Mycobacterium sp. TaxID=1785 RepID=UPI001EB5DBFA|nr:hypothetical protein [Mycobacterium sp.]MBV8787542.1 hypothetical protein [Mycobacterium sp.]
MVNSEGIGTLKLECPQSHPVGKILKEAPHQAVQYDPGAQVGPRRFWPDEEDQPEFKTSCRFCDKPVAGATTLLQTKLSELINDAAETVSTTTLAYV